MSPAKKKTKASSKKPASAGRKRGSAEAAPARSRRAAAAPKKAKPAAAPPPPPVPPTARRAPAVKKAGAPGAKSAPRSPAAGLLPERPPVPLEGRPQLGSRWECFKCGAKFYDLNKPEPLCPKCGANQHQRPKVDTKARIPAEGPPVPRPARVIPPLLDEEEDAVVTDEELDLGIAVDDEAFIEGDEDEEFGEEEEEEEP